MLSLGRNPSQSKGLWNGVPLETRGSLSQEASRRPSESKCLSGYEVLSVRRPLWTGGSSQDFALPLWKTLPPISRAIFNVCNNTINKYYLFYRICSCPVIIAYAHPQVAQHMRMSSLGMSPDPPAGLRTMYVYLKRYNLILNACCFCRQRLLHSNAVPERRLYAALGTYLERRCLNISAASAVQDCAISTTFWTTMQC